MKPTNTLRSHSTKAISHDARKNIALKVICHKKTITDAANDNNVSRKFVHRLKNQALDSIDQSFTQKIKNGDPVLFNLPVTKTWLQQFSLSLALNCRSSFRGISKVLNDVFDYDISIGTVHNISDAAVQKAKEINSQEDLKQVTLGAHDEIFHRNKPILAGVDIPSLYCYLLSEERHRDSDTWAIHLWDLEKQGLNPERFFADDGDGLRAGHNVVFPQIPCDADHFHIIKKLTDMRRFFQNRLKSAISYHNDMKEKMERAKKNDEPQLLSKKLGLAKQHEVQMQYLSNSINTLVSWMQMDVLNKAGANPFIRRELYDFILDEFKNLSAIHPHRIQDICVALKNQEHFLLAFTHVLDRKFQTIADQYACDLKTVWKICELQRCKIDGDNYAIRSIPLILLLEDKLVDIEDAVIAALNSTERTSSMIENLNSRLRPFFFLRREIGFDYLELLRFYLNHTPFLRSENNRANKTPAELLTGKSHSHWLEMLGFERFKRAA